MAELGLSKSRWGFDPRSVPGCMSWIDAADTFTLTLSGNNVTSIRDKANYVNCTVTGTMTTGLLTLNGNNLLNFVDSSGVITGNIFASQTRTLFIVAQIDNSTIPVTSPRTYNFFGGPTSGASMSLYYWQGSGNLSGGRSGLDAVVVAASNLPATGFFNSSFILSFGNSPNDIRVNGTSLTLTTNTAFTMTTGTITQTINASINSRQSWRLGELLLYDDAVSASNRQVIEGYLANKWGLTAALPLAHPYKSVRPFGRQFLPSDVSTCILWLDGADSRSMTFSGSSITQWNDKSGSNNHMISNAGNTLPTYATQSLNGIPVVTFVNTTASGDALRTTNAITNVPRTAFVVGRYRTASPGSFFGGSQTSRFAPYEMSFNRYSVTNVFNSQFQATGPTVISNWYVTTYLAPLSTTAGVAATQVNVDGSGGNVLSAVMSGTAETAIKTTIGMGFTFNAYAAGGTHDIAEVIVFSSLLSNATIRQLQGYLAWKWGSVSKLPTPHLFNSNRLNPQGVV